MKTVAKYILLYLFILFIMIVTMVCVSIIPRGVIQNKSEESADLLMQKNLHFYNLYGDTSSDWTELRYGDFSKTDQIADTILLNIAYSIDPEHPLKSILWAGYYSGNNDPVSSLKTMNESYARVVVSQNPPNRQYLRYWHGSLILVRPMLMIWNLRQMKVALGIAIAGLILTLLLILIQKGFTAEAISLAISMSVVSIWFVPLSLEYIWMFLLMLVVSVIAVILVLTDNADKLFLLFFLSGMLAAYFDFFTTETLALLIPLLLIIRMMSSESGNDGNALERQLWICAGKSSFLWGIGYVASWSAKWVVSAIFLRMNVVPYIQHVRMHLGLTDQIPAFQQMYEALLRNIWPLFPIGYGRAGAMIFAVLVLLFVFLPVYKNRVVLKSRVNWKRVFLYMLLGSIVYIRLVILRHHSWYHYFFTYRAQAASILALCFIILEFVEIQTRKDQSSA